MEFRGWKGKTWQQRKTKGTAVTCINFLHLLYTLCQSITFVVQIHMSWVNFVPSPQKLIELCLHTWNSTKWFINTVCSVPGHFTFADILMIPKFSSILHFSKPANHVKIGLDHLIISIYIKLFKWVSISSVTYGYVGYTQQTSKMPAPSSLDWTARRYSNFFVSVSMTFLHTFTYHQHLHSPFMPLLVRWYIWNTSISNHNFRKGWTVIM